MEAKAIAGGEGVPADFAGMTKNQLYDIMSQMKTLIEQNKQQARDILIQNPTLTRALFQAQIMLGMLQPPRSPALPQQPQQSNIQPVQPLPGQVIAWDQAGSSQAPHLARKELQHQAPIVVSSAPAPSVNIQSHPVPLQPLQPPQQPRGHLNPQVTLMPVPPPSLVSNIPHSLHSSSQPPLQPPQIPAPSTQVQQPFQSTGISHMTLQPPLSQPRPLSVPSFHHQYGPQISSNVGFQTGGPQHISQPMFHSGNRPGPPFPLGQPTIPSQPPPQPVYQAGGSRLGAEYSSQGGSSMQVDRGAPWMSGLSENSMMTQLPGPPTSVPVQMGPGNQPNQSTPLTPEMEKALLQQVMSLTPEQINLLPPDQRNQVLQLQQMLRQ